LKIHFILHESFESPAAIEDWAKKNASRLTYTRLHDGDSFPPTFDFDFLIIMGGPQCPATTPDECPHFDGKKEIEFIKEAIKRDKILLGVCLGAQFIGEAMGGHFEHSPNREIGVFPVTLTKEGEQDPIVGKFPKTFPVAHWHGDMPGLTDTSEILAASEGCPRQIVRYGPKIYGFQCHFEFTPNAVEEMIQNNAAELEQFRSLPYIETAEQLRSHDFTSMNDLLIQFLDKLAFGSASSQKRANA